MAPLTFYTGASPNGYKVSTLLEELKAAYPGKIDYEVRSMNFSANEQKEPWYIEINPNGKIPALVDESNGGFKVFESAAIELYLAQRYDTDHKFSFDPVNDVKNYSEMLQWIFFVHGGLGPMIGQAFHFKFKDGEKIQYGTDRYVEETRRLYGVLEIRLKDRDWLAGPGRGTFSLADLNAGPWGFAAKRLDIDDFEEKFPNVAAWFERFKARPAVYAGLGIPTRRNPY